MANIESGEDTTLLTVDPTTKAARVSIRPREVIAWNSLGVTTGLTTVLAANAPIFSFRNLSPSPVFIRRIGISMIATTAFTTAQRVEYALRVARAWTTADSGGTAITITGNDTKHDTTLASPASMEARVATTGALTAGTRTLDANALAIVGAHIAGIGSGLPPSTDNLFEQGSGDYPLVIRQNEGIVITNNFLMGAAGVVVAYINLEFAQNTTL